MLEVAGTFVAMPHAVSTWVLHSAPGRVCVYARVDRLPRGGVGERVRHLHAAGLVKMLPQRRCEGGLYDYRVQRTSLPFQQARPVPDEKGLSPNARLLMELLVAIADQGAQCPTDRDLAACLGLKHAHQVGHLMSVLRDRHLVRVDWHEAIVNMPVRVVTITDTGASTRLPSVPATRGQQ
ncbi:hypothetical protein [Sphingomonas koreensis]|uniref:hypothetical protein n=1 Tax=Sphingomonas koreensis TaxID=93064 RepID=UPI000F7E81CB|nr:hypothetical protein [Sphingomonas koreensis]